MKGLYFYKLNSPYAEDVTKDYKLTINEIDSNFITLKDADIKDVSFDKERLVLQLTQNNGDVLEGDFSSVLDGVVNNLVVDYDEVQGNIIITHNDERYVIGGLVTNANITDKVMTNVVADETLVGLGNKIMPLGIAAVEKTGTYKPARKLVDIIEGEKLPKCTNIKGDRYVTRELVSDYGYLYNFAAVKAINADLKHGWRIPTKEDWDNMLNAVELCDGCRNHNSPTANNMLGEFAGKVLKSRHAWLPNPNIPSEGESDTESAEEEVSSTPKKKYIPADGIDSFRMRIMPSGFYDGTDVVDYFTKRAYFWSTTEISETDIYIKRFDFNKSGVVQNVESPRNFFSIRLVKDYTGHNYHGLEQINGMNFTTVLMPSLNTEYGHTVWTRDNVAFTNEKYHPVAPNNGEDLHETEVYFINEWNGFDWERKQLFEGDSIVLIEGLNGEKDIEYRIVDGVLYSEAATIYDKIMEEIRPELDDMHESIEDLDDRMETAEENVAKLQDDTVELRNDLTQTQKDLEAEQFSREQADILIHDEMERIEAAVGLTIADIVGDDSETFGASEVGEPLEGGNFINRPDANYINGSETVMGCIDVLDEELKKVQDELDATQKGCGLAADGGYVAKEDGHYIADAENLAEAVNILDESLHAEEVARVALQEEVDYTQANLGFEDDGTYPKKEDGHYIGESDTLVESVHTLDDALNDEEIARIVADNLLQEELDSTQSAIGTTEDGEYVPTEGKFTKDAKTVMEAIESLDESLANEESARIAEDERQWARMIVNGEHSNEVPYYNRLNALDSDGKVAFDCANGVLTLHTNDGSQDILIRLNGDYGVIPYED